MNLLKRLFQKALNRSVKKKKEAVNHPAHYNIPGKKECIDEMIEKFGLEPVRVFCLLNAYKYNYRHEYKGGQEDLEKAKWYMKKYAELGGDSVE